MNVDMINVINSLNLKDSKQTIKTSDNKNKFSELIKKEETKLGEKPTKNKEAEVTNSKNKNQTDTKENEENSEEKIDKNIYTINQAVINPNLIVINDNIKAELNQNLSILDLEAVDFINANNNELLKTENIDTNLVNSQLASVEPEILNAVKEEFKTDLKVLLDEDLSLKDSDSNIGEIKKSISESDLKSKLNFNSMNRVVSKRELETNELDNAKDINVEVDLKSIKNLEENKSSELKEIVEEPTDGINLEFKDVIASKNISSNEKVSLFSNIDKPRIHNLEEINTQMIKLVEITGEGDVNTMKVQLYPKDLGTLDISVTLENGNLKAKILVENESVKSLFTKNLEDLNQNLLKQNIEVKEFIVDVNSGFNENNQNAEEHDKKRNTFMKEFNLSNKTEFDESKTRVEDLSNLNVLA